MVYKWLHFVRSQGRSQIRSWLRSGLFPPICVLCGDPGHQGLDLCSGCFGDLPYNPRSCTQCAAPLAEAEIQLVCGDCQRSPPWFQHSVAPYRYQQPMVYLIHQLKFAGKLSMARLLGDLLAIQVMNCKPKPDFLIPVPLHRKRLGERGFNQALEISRIVGKRLGIPVNYRACKRVLSTTAQTLVPADKRRANVRDAFLVCGVVAGKHVAIIDDVMTTGHTVNELARVLVRAGASQVDIWVLARAGQG